MKQVVLLLFILTATFGARLGHAQANETQAALLADRVEIDATGALLATGNIEIIYGMVRLEAAEIRYDPDSDQMRITGPILLEDGDSDAVLLASEADLDRDLRNGILRSARMVISEQLQIAASELRRVDGRYTQLFQTVASTCQVCVNGKAPLWQIRAESITHDQQKQRLYFRNAQFEVSGVRVMRLPRLSMPDPTVQRATGLLAPRFSNSSRLGPRLEMPYFITLGDHADVTLSPALSPKSRSLGLTYRRALANGTLEFDSAITSDDLGATGPRGFAHVTGSFALPRGFDLGVEGWWLSDRAYGADYGVFGGSRLPNTVTLDRTREADTYSFEATYQRTLRGSELGYQDRLPDFIVDAAWQRIASSRPAGGKLTFGLELNAYRRAAQSDVTGRDSVQLEASADWAAASVVGPGIALEAQAGISAIGAIYADDTAHAGLNSAMRPYAGATLRWPLERTVAGATTSLQPVLRLGWEDSIGDRLPNEDGRLQELDFGSLFSPDRTAGNDLALSGQSLAGGLVIGHEMASGHRIELAAARLWQATPPGGVSRSSGLGRFASDWIVGVEYGFPRQLELASIAQLNGDGEAIKATSRLDWSDAKRGIGLSHIWLDADADENRNRDLSELTLDAHSALWAGWNGSANLSFDLVRERPMRAGVELTYQTECVRVDLSLSRRFTSSGNLLRDTSFGLEVNLIGFGSDGRAYRRACYDAKG